ncbi:hypothetical protein OOZ63_00850 [Paucibacter sp. PLA-PC-4]|uniref:hypothetical protein n=1 Tax=Paucibacter sp. PLA-PC-4 TaxID=2993655 RepID=UPI002249132E|nr:hypothetical protein [Paucibacter sp. PLA-PC-4]MCX2860386.1 hypothetical protein [Paucibacter sp. PLA-PC-4]
MRQRTVVGRRAAAGALALRQSGLTGDLMLTEANSAKAPLATGMAVSGAYLLDQIAALSPRGDTKSLPRGQLCGCLQSKG